MALTPTQRSVRARASVAKGDAEEAAGRQLLEALGARVWKLGGRGHRRKGQEGPVDYSARQTPGAPDIKAFLPPRGAQAWRGLWWESKAGTGRLSPDQRRFKELAEFAGEAYVAGDRDVLIAWLVAEGYARTDQFPHYRVHPTSGGPRP